jgi:N-acyl-D-aspartate/D-glutamate deacylase
MNTFLRNAKIIDGTGSPARRGDLAIVDGRIAEIGGPGELENSNGAKEQDIEGLVLAPGFIDLHTHLDAQVLWDPDLFPSPWHGVTSVLMGNCGFGFAPTRPEDRELAMLIMVNAEGMSLDDMRAGIPWTFSTYPEYLDIIEKTPKRINMTALIGHTPIRVWVMGDDALNREATASEIDKMCEMVTEAVRAGARGFSTSQQGHAYVRDGRPIPSRLASREEIYRLGEAVAAAGRHDVIIEVAIGRDFHLEEAAELARRSGVRVTWIPATTGSDSKGNQDTAPPGTAIGYVERSVELGIWPQVCPRAVSTQLYALEPRQMVSFINAFKEVLATPPDSRVAIHRDKAWRERAKAGAAGKGPLVWPKIIIEETKTHQDLVGKSLAQVAADRGIDPLDLYADLVVEDELFTRFRWLKTNADAEEVAKLVSHSQSLIGLGDAGAHMNEICEAGNGTGLLQLWVRESPVLSLEKAIRKMTGQAADFLGFTDRGYIRQGYAADLVAFNPSTVGQEPQFERRYDLPAGGDRLLVHSLGVEHVWVNGVAIRQEGEDVDLHEYPGRLLRS